MVLSDTQLNELRRLAVETGRRQFAVSADYWNALSSENYTAEERKMLLDHRDELGREVAFYLRLIQKVVEGR